MDFFLRLPGATVIDFVAIVLSLTTLLVVLIGRIRRRRRQGVEIDPSSPATFTSEMTIHLVAQRYAQSLDRITRVIDDEWTKLSALIAPPAPPGFGADPGNRRAIKPEAKDLSHGEGRLGMVDRMTHALAGAEALLEDGRDPADVFDKRPVAKEGIELIARVKAARCDADSTHNRAK